MLIITDYCDELDPSSGPHSFKIDPSRSDLYSYLISRSNYPLTQNSSINTTAAWVMGLANAAKAMISKPLHDLTAGRGIISNFDLQGSTDLKYQVWNNGFPV